MPKEWDHLMKWLAHANPQHLVSLLVKDALFESEAINELQVQSREIQADILYNILWKRQRAILHAEFQRRRDADIGRRVWEMIEELQAAHKQDLLALAYSFNGSWCSN